MQTLTISLSPQLWTPVEHQRTRRLPAAARRTYPGPNKESFTEEQNFRTAAFLSNISQQLFSAAFCGSLSQQPFSTALLQQLFSTAIPAAFLSSLAEQPFSPASQQPSSAIISLVRGWLSARLLTSSCCGQESGVDGHLLPSSCCGQGLVVSYCHHLGQGLLANYFIWHHLFVVRGLLSALDIILPWSGVGGHLLPSSCCGQGLVVSYCHHLAMVRGW